MWHSVFAFLLIKSGAVATVRRAAVVVDVTNEQYVGPGSADIWHKEEVLSTIEKLLGGGEASPQWDAVFDCRNWIYSTEDAAWGPNGWKGGEPGSKGAELVPRLDALRRAAEKSNSSTSKWRFVGKPTFSCLHDTTMMHALLTLKIDELYVMGINTEQCVFMTIIDAWRSQAAADVFLVADAATSYAGEEGHLMGMRMIHTVSNATVINSTDIALRPAETMELSAVMV